MTSEYLEEKPSKKMSPLWSAIVEVGFIVFLFYSNLLMGEFTHSGQGQTRGLLWAVHDVVTKTNLCIAIGTALLGYMVFEFLRKRL